MMVLVGCAPAPGGTGGAGNGVTTTTAPPATTAPVAGDPQAPVIHDFAASTVSGSSPLTTALSWTLTDSGNDTETCRLDLDGNGSFDQTISPCPYDSRITRTFTTVGTYNVTLEVNDGTWTTTATVGLIVTAPSVDSYAVTLRLSAGMTTNQSNAFNTAAAKWAGIVKTGQPDRPLNIAANYCANGTQAFSGTVDDLLIDAQIIPIDGPGGILGQAGPCIVRSSNGIPLYGIMQFDSADVASLETSGQLANTIVHEMGHILGIGTIWTSPMLTGAGTSNPTFNGANAVAAWRELGGTGNVPVENSGGAGTADSHWRESIFRTELMTGYLNSTNQLSRLTSASLADLGYGVDLAGSDAYTLPALRASSVHAASVPTGASDPHGDIITILPKASV